MQAPYLVVRSAVPGVAWPAITGPEEATALALQYQVERSQWLPPDELHALQLRQLDALVRHARLTVPFYRWHWHGADGAGETLTRESFRRLPLLRRENLQYDLEELKSTAPPAAHGEHRADSEGRAAGPAATPVRVPGTGLTDMWQRVLTLRDHLWHCRDFDGTLAVIGEEPDEGEAQGWGSATDVIAAAGRSVFLGMRTDTDAQLEWLLRHQPHYLMTDPSNVARLAERAITRGVRFTALREVLTSGEPVEPEMRELCRAAWDVPLTGLYATGEAGYVALQCPDHEHYHVQSESVLVEVLDEQDKPCAPGAMGRIVITTLQNFAMPLVRYDSGDLAEVGDPCPCGRGLPVLRRIAGSV